MKTFKIIYFISISLAVIVSFAYLSARLEIHKTQHLIAEKALERSLLEQQMHRLSPTAQLSSAFPLQIAILDEQATRQLDYVNHLKPYASLWVLLALLILWGIALTAWYQMRRQMGLKIQVGSGQLWVGRLLFFGGLALVASAVFLSNGQTEQMSGDNGGLLLAGLILAVLGVVVRVKSASPRN